MTAAKVMEIISRLPDAVSVHTQVKNERCSKIIENSQIGMSRHLDTSTEPQMAPVIVQYGKYHLARLSWVRQFKTFQIGNALSSNEKNTFLFWACGRYKTDWKETKHWPNKKKELMKDLMWENRHHSLTLIKWVALKENIEISMDIVENYRTMFESKICAGHHSVKLGANISSWLYDMQSHAKKYVERYNELTNKTTQQLYKITTTWTDDHQFTEEEMWSVGELSEVCSQFLLKCTYLTRSDRPDNLWSVNKLARAVTKWTRACEFEQSCGKHTTKM